LRAGGRASMRFPRQFRWPYGLYHGLSIYLSNNNNNNNNNNSWLQHPNNRGTKGCAVGPAMVN